MELVITHVVEGDHDILAVRGELDVSTYTTLRSRVGDLIDSGRTNVVLDLAGTEFLDSTALGAMIGGRRRAYAAGGSFAIVCENPQLLRMFTLTKLDKVFSLWPTMDEWRSRSTG